MALKVSTAMQWTRMMRHEESVYQLILNHSANRLLICHFVGTVVINRSAFITQGIPFLVLLLPIQELSDACKLTKLLLGQKNVVDLLYISIWNVRPLLYIFFWNIAKKHKCINHKFQKSYPEFLTIKFRYLLPKRWINSSKPSNSHDAIGHCQL